MAITPINPNQAYTEIFGSGTKWKPKQATPAEQYKADVAYWYGTVTSAGQTWKSDLLTRMWALMWHGGLWMRGRAGSWQAWSDADMPIASCLSHGGRVLVQLTRNADEAVWRWLWGRDPTTDKAVNPQGRHAATHGIQVAWCGLMPDGRPKHVRETKKGGGGGHFGVNVAGGGLNNTNPISGNRITDDGRHGHLYIYYVKPTLAERGALLFGAEDSAPIDRAKTQWNQAIGGFFGNTVLLPLTLIDLATGGGSHHQPWSPGLRSAFPKGQTGAYHAIGASGKYSLTGGKKFKTLAKVNVNVPFGNDCMFVNPPVDVWQSLLDGTLTFNRNDLGSPPPKRSDRSVLALPSAKEFKKDTYVGKLHSRDERLKNMDRILTTFEADSEDSDRSALLDDFIYEATMYLAQSHDPESTKAKVQGYRDTVFDYRQARGE